MKMSFKFIFLKDNSIMITSLIMNTLENYYLNVEKSDNAYEKNYVFNI